MAVKSNWYVVTGPPSSGKSTVLARFEKMGYRVIPEAARVFIDKELTKRKTIQDIRKDEAEFQRKVLEQKVKIENELPKEEVVFFDRAIPDSIAYYPLCGLDSNEALKVCAKNLYRKVFLMEQLPFKQDDIRTEGAEAIRELSKSLREAYEQLEYEVVFVPVMSVEDRVKFIQSHLKQ